MHISVHHPTELKSKSTAMQAKVLAPDHVFIREFPDEIPEYDPEDTVLLFPSKVRIRIAPFMYVWLTT